METMNYDQFEECVYALFEDLQKKGEDFVNKRKDLIEGNGFANVEVWEEYLRLKQLWQEASANYWRFIMNQLGGEEALV
jgi:hypothetical protein